MARGRCQNSFAHGRRVNRAWPQTPAAVGTVRAESPHMRKAHGNSPSPQSSRRKVSGRRQHWYLQECSGGRWEREG